MCFLGEGTGAPESEESGTTDVVMECVDEKGLEGAHRSG